MVGSGSEDSNGYIYNLGQKFDQVASIFHDNMALILEHESFTYLELLELSNRLANYLLDQGLGSRDVIAIFNEKSVLSYAMMLASLKTGMIYVNLDLSSPKKRLKKVLDNCNPKKIFADSHRDLEDRELQILNSDFLKIVSDYSKEFRSSRTLGTDPAYIMFTSGSTGFPKGVTISHQNVLNFIDWSIQTFNIRGTDRFTNVNPMYFDNSVFDFYSSLFTGASLVPVGSELSTQSRRLVDYVNLKACTIWFSVPSMLVYLLTTKSLRLNDFTSFRKLIFGGEGFSKPKLKELFQLYGHRLDLVNVYGPTECTCICSSYTISEIDFEDTINLAPLGFLAPNFGFEILNQSQDGIGELCLKGPNVGIGYYNDPERTHSSFIQNPVNGEYPEIVYKTGDLVKLDKNGMLHFMGRADNQIKHMGYRIELEEIEAVCNSLEYVTACVVVYQPLGQGLGQIEAFLQKGSHLVEPKSVLSDLRKLLPKYMLPKKIMFIDTLPKNSNGKVDRKAVKELSANG